jgi:hypothetical protein
MRSRRLAVLTIAAVMAAVLPLGAISLASAQVVLQPVDHFEIVPFEFTMTPEQCPDIDTTISGSGAYHTWISEIPLTNGGTGLRVSSTANGYATDSEGNVYTYSYGNYVRGTIPPAGPAVFAQFDFFNLSGEGSAGGLAVAWTAILYFTETLPGEGPPDDMQLFPIRGNPNCDPI